VVLLVWCGRLIICGDSFRFWILFHRFLVQRAFWERAAGAVLGGRRFDSTKRFSCVVLAKNTSYFPIGLILELRNRLEVVKNLWNELVLVDCPTFYRIRLS
jgi:hypothetical protein